MLSEINGGKYVFRNDLGSIFKVQRMGSGKRHHSFFRHALNNKGGIGNTNPSFAFLTVPDKGPNCHISFILASKRPRTNPSQPADLPPWLAHSFIAFDCSPANRSTVLIKPAACGFFTSFRTVMSIGDTSFP